MSAPRACAASAAPPLGSARAALGYFRLFVLNSGPSPLNPPFFLFKIFLGRGRGAGVSLRLAFPTLLLSALPWRPEKDGPGSGGSATAGGAPAVAPSGGRAPPPSGQCRAGEGAGVPALPHRGAGGQPRGSGAGRARPSAGYLRCGLRGERRRCGGCGPRVFSAPTAGGLRRSGPGLWGPRWNFRGGRGVVTGGIGVLWGSSPETVRESRWAGGASVPVLLRVPSAGEGVGKGNPHTPAPPVPTRGRSCRLCGGAWAGGRTPRLGEIGFL